MVVKKNRLLNINRNDTNIKKQSKNIKKATCLLCNVLLAKTKDSNASNVKAIAPLNLSIRIEEMISFFDSQRPEMLNPLNTSPAIKEGKKRLKNKPQNNAKNASLNEIWIFR